MVSGVLHCRRTGSGAITAPTDGSALGSRLLLLILRLPRKPKRFVNNSSASPVWLGMGAVCVARKGRDTIKFSPA